MSQDLDGPLELAELVGVSPYIGVKPPRVLPKCLLDFRPTRPSPPEAGRMDPHRAEPQDAERCVDPFRLQVELAEVVEDASCLVASLDAEASVVLAYRGTCVVIAVAGEAVEPVRHDGGWALAFMGFRVRRGGQSLY